MKAEKGDTHARLWVHNKDVNNGGKTYKATDGTFLSIVEPDSGGKHLVQSETNVD